MPEAYFTLLYNDVYLPGALVLAQALRSYGTTRELAVLVGSQVSDYAVTRLSQVFDHIIPTETISNSSADAPQFKLLGRPELERSYTKVHVWRQTQFSRIVFLDADTLPLRNLDELFSEEVYPLDSSTPIAASPDIGWPDIFNSGVFVTFPNTAIYDTLVGRAKAGLSFDGGDQGLLNQYFEGRWKRLPFTYNVTPSASYQYTPAYQHFKDSVNVVHFIGADKPWSHAFTGPWPSSSEFELKWWAIYNQFYTSDLTLKSVVETVVEIQQPQPAFDNLDYIPTIIEKPAPAPVYYPPAIIEEDIDHWDATRYQPPRDSKPEAANLVIEHYHNAWDTHQPSQQHHHHEHRSEQQQYAASDGENVPKQEIVEHHDPTPPAPVFHVNPEPVKPVFPWEFASNQAEPERVFPEEEEEEEEEEYYEEEKHFEPEPEINQEKEEEPTKEEQLQEPFNFIQTQKALESLIHSEDTTKSNVTREFRDYSLPPDSHSFGSSSKNVWDEDPKIQSYVSRIQFQFNRGCKAKNNYEDEEDEKDENQSSHKSTVPEETDDEDSGVDELDIKESIADAESEVKANTIVHAKIHSENDSGVILKKRTYSRKQKQLEAINFEFDSVYSPSPATSAMAFPKDGLDMTSQPATGGRLLLPVTPRTGLSDAESIETSSVGEDDHFSLPLSSSKLGLGSLSSGTENAENSDEDEPWDPAAKLAELAQLSSLIVAKQAEFEAKYEKKFGKRPGVFSTS
ncbi:hypothetical protein D0Z03_000354 [Geotrichum reessii]|nr:hypothetical protein D0Z03_000354 [Galactomyces reessii]